MDRLGQLAEFFEDERADFVLRVTQHDFQRIGVGFGQLVCGLLNGGLIGSKRRMAERHMLMDGASDGQFAGIELRWI